MRRMSVCGAWRAARACGGPPRQQEWNVTLCAPARSSDPDAEIFVLNLHQGRLQRPNGVGGVRNARISVSCPAAHPSASMACKPHCRR